MAGSVPSEPLLPLPALTSLLSPFLNSLLDNRPFLLLAAGGISNVKDAGTCYSSLHPPPFFIPAQLPLTPPRLNVKMEPLIIFILTYFEIWGGGGALGKMNCDHQKQALASLLTVQEAWAPYASLESDSHTDHTMNLCFTHCATPISQC